MRPARTTREQRKDWLASRGMSESGLNRGIKDMVEKDIARQARKTKDNTKKRRAKKEYKKWKINQTRA